MTIRIFQTKYKDIDAIALETDTLADAASAADAAVEICKSLAI